MIKTATGIKTDSKENVEQFLNWLVHEKIAGADKLTPETFAEGLSDGVVFLRVMEHIYKDSVDWTKTNQPAAGLFQKMDNCSYLATLCKDFGLPAEGIQAKSLAEGNFQAVLSLLWLLMRQSFIVLNGATSEEEIRKLAQKFVARNLVVEPEPLEYESLSLVMYYGVQGEVFVAFSDEEEIECPFLPNDFSLLISAPVLPCSPCMQEPTNQKTGPSRQFTKNSKSTKIVMNHSDTTSSVVPAQQNDRKHPLSSLPISLVCSPKQNLEFFIKPCKILESSASSIRLEKNLKSNFVKSDPKQTIRLPEMMDDLSKTIFKDYSSMIFKRQRSIISSENTIPCKDIKIPTIESPRETIKDYRVPELSLSAMKSRPFPIIIESIYEPNKAKRPEQVKRMDSYEVGLIMDEKSNEKGSMGHKQNLAGSRTEKIIQKGEKETSSNWEIKEKAEVIEEPTGSESNNFVVSEIFEDFERSNSLQIFEGYATVLRKMKDLKKDKNIQRRSALDNFKVSKIKAGTPYYLRQPHSFNSLSLLPLLKVHEKFAGSHFKELFNHGYDKSQIVDIKSDEEKLTDLIGVIAKTASRIGLATTIKPLLQSTTSIKDLSVIDIHLHKTRKYRQFNSNIERLLQKRLQNCLRSQSEDGGHQHESLTVVKILDLDYLDLRIYQSLDRDSLKTFYKSVLNSRLQEDSLLSQHHQQNCHVGELLPNYYYQKQSPVLPPSGNLPGSQDSQGKTRSNY